MTRRKPQRGNIVLIGFMATGKGSIGRLLVARLGRDFVDTDDMIEQREGKPICRIFEDNGEPHFRAVESQMVEEAARRENVVIACGGGAIVDPDNLTVLQGAGWLICLTATPETVLARAGDLSDRPLLCKPDPVGEIRRLLEERALYYEQADFTVATDNLTEQEVVRKIEEIVSREGLL